MTGVSKNYMFAQKYMYEMVKYMCNVTQDILVMMTGRSKTCYIQQGAGGSVALNNFNVPKGFKRLCEKKKFLRLCRRGQLSSQYEASMNGEIQEALRSFNFLFH